MYGSNTNALLGHVDRLISYGSTSPLCQPSLPAFSLYVKTSAHWLPTNCYYVSHVTIPLESRKSY